MQSTIEPLALGERITVDVHRARPWGYNAKPDETVAVADLITNSGRVFLAERINKGDSVNSAMAFTAVGTVATTPALANTTLTGEIDRKVSAVSSALTNNVYTNVATWGGFADSVQSIAIVEAGVFNDVRSGQGTMFQRVTFAAVTLANSDLLKVTMETVVGSNTI